MTTVAESALQTHCATLTSALAQHPLYATLTTPQQLRLFMRSHVFAVWDFQSLLKALQIRLTGVTVPWLPTADPEARRLINAIVLDEESDLSPDGRAVSHFELYLEAMQQAGADRQPILHFLARLRAGDSVAQALTDPSLPPGVADFVGTTFDLIASNATHQIAAAFTYGREAIIPTLFLAIVQQLAAQRPEQWSGFAYYLERHIHCDAEEHGPQAHRLVARLCGNDPQRWLQAQVSAQRALAARQRLWNAIQATTEADQPHRTSCPA